MARVLLSNYYHLMIETPELGFARLWAPGNPVPPRH
jgi:hypothetical protein